MLQKLHFISILLCVVLLNQSVSATFEQKLRNIRKQYPRVHPYEPTNQAVNKQPTSLNNDILDNPQMKTTQMLNNLPVNQPPPPPPRKNKSIKVLPDDVLRAISNNLDLESNLNLGSTGKLIRNATQERRNIQILEKKCSPYIYWSLTQNGHSIFLSHEFERLGTIEERERCLRAIILNHEIVKPALKYLTIIHPRSHISRETTLSYLDALETLFNKTDHLESITIKSEYYNFIVRTVEYNLEYETRLLRIVSKLNVSSIEFNTEPLNENLFSQFTRVSSVRSLKIDCLRDDQAKQLKHLKNLESISLWDQISPIDFASLKHLRHVQAHYIRLNLDSIFSGENIISSIDTHPRDRDLDLRLQNTTKRMTSLMIDIKQVDPLTFQVLFHVKSTLKHLKIFMNDNRQELEPFFKDNKVLESITVYTSTQPMEFLEFTNNIKYFAFRCDFKGSSDKFLIQFIKREKYLKSLSIYLWIPLTEKSNRNISSSFLTYLDQIVEAILTQKTIKELSLGFTPICVGNRTEFSMLFHKTLSKLGGLDLSLNGVPIKNVIRDLKVIDDSVFESDTEEELTIAILSRDFPIMY